MPSDKQIELLIGIVSLYVGFVSVFIGVVLSMGLVIPRRTLRPFRILTPFLTATFTCKLISGYGDDALQVMRIILNMLLNPGISIVTLPMSFDALSRLAEFLLGICLIYLLIRLSGAITELSETERRDYTDITCI